MTALSEVPLRKTSFRKYLRLGLLLHFSASLACAQGGHPQAPPPPPNAKIVKCSARPVPQFEDVTAKTGHYFSTHRRPFEKIHRGIHERRRNSF